MVQGQAREHGVQLDVGTFPSHSDTVSPADPERAVRLTAHAIARIADRFPLARRVSRHLEGTEKRAGLASDILAVLAEILRRNPDVIEQRLETFGDELKRARASRVQHAENGASPQFTTTEGVA